MGSDSQMIYGPYLILKLNTSLIRVLYILTRNVNKLLKRFQYPDLGRFHSKLRPERGPDTIFRGTKWRTDWRFGGVGNTPHSHIGSREWM